MSKPNDNPADPFKKALAEATRAMANEPELSVTYSVDPPGLTNEAARLPQVSLPLGETASGPVGLGLVAGHGNDEMLLDLAVTLAN